MAAVCALVSWNSTIPPRLASTRARTSASSPGGDIAFQSLAHRSAPKTTIPRRSNRSSRACEEANPGKRKNGVLERHAVEQRMRKRVVGDRMTLAQGAAGELRMRERIAPQQKERGPRAFALERIENAGGGAGRRPVVEGEHDLLGGERKGVMKMLAADARRRRGVDRQDACGAERFG